jgi:hypothetical protein
MTSLNQRLTDMATAIGARFRNIETALGATVTTSVFTSGTNGLAPASGGGTTNFLRADATWDAPTASLASQANNTVLGNVSGSSATPSALTQAQLAGLAISPVTTQSGTSYTALIGDANTYIRFTNASAVTFTIPLNASVAFPVNTVIEMEQAGAGTLTVAAAGGVTINSRASHFSLAGQFGVAALKKVATDTWTLTGDI